MAIWILLQKIVSLIDILSATSNDMAIFLFKTIAQANSGVGNLLKTKLNLNRRQYYSKLSSLTKAGLIKRKNGKYFLTALGKVVYDAQLVIENAVNNY
jgi:predicted transcriptional regulator